MAIVPIIATLLFVIGGFFIFAGAGNPSMYERGKTILISVVIGLIIIYTAWVLIETVLGFLGIADWTGLGSWWEIKCD